MDISVFKDLKMRSLLCFKMLGFSHPVTWSNITEERNLRSGVFFFPPMYLYMGFHILTFKVAYTSKYDFKPNFFITEHSQTSYFSQDSKHVSHCFTKAGHVLCISI